MKKNIKYFTIIVALCLSKSAEAEKNNEKAIIRTTAPKTTSTENKQIQKTRSSISKQTKNRKPSNDSVTWLDCLFRVYEDRQTSTSRSIVSIDTKLTSDIYHEFDMRHTKAKLKISYSQMKFEVSVISGRALLEKTSSDLKNDLSIDITIAGKTTAAQYRLLCTPLPSYE
jgi:ABC-type uncharacterized transport system auxiliary subunit